MGSSTGPTGWATVTPALPTNIMILTVTTITVTLTPTATIPITTARRSTPGTNAAKLFLFFCQFDYLDKKIVEYNFNGENLSGANQVNLVTKFANGQS